MMMGGPYEVDDMVYCPLIGYGYSPERLAEIKETILKPGARWYCDHFREKFRAYRDEHANQLSMLSLFSGCGGILQMIFFPKHKNKQFI